MSKADMIRGKENLSLKSETFKQRQVKNVQQSSGPVV